MPEIPICIHCREPIDCDKEKYVVTNKDETRYEDKWLYAHPNCQKKSRER